MPNAQEACVNHCWRQGDPSDNSAYGYYNGTQLPGDYRYRYNHGRKLTASTVPYTAAVQAALLANNTPQTNITVRGAILLDLYCPINATHYQEPWALLLPAA